MFQARSLLALSDAVYDFDDALLCGSDERPRERTGAELVNNSFLLFPNPAKDRIEISYDIPTEGQTEIRIQNEIGQLVFSESINTEQGRKQVDLEKFPPGIYFCSIHQNEKILKVEKFVVIK